MSGRIPDIHDVAEDAYNKGFDHGFEVGKDAYKERVQQAIEKMGKIVLADGELREYQEVDFFIVKLKRELEF